MKKILIILLFFLASVPFQAAAQQWNLDPVHTNFYFDVRHTYAAVRGQFGDFTGDVYFDPANPEKSRFAFVIRVDSVDTKVGKRDTHLRSPDFLNPLKPGEIVAGLDARLTIDRLEYHVGDGKFYKMGVVGKDVDILFTLELLREK
jgi:polyisoprenoid-binding protein YceI